MQLLISVPIIFGLLMHMLSMLSGARLMVTKSNLDLAFDNSLWPANAGFKSHCYLYLNSTYVYHSILESWTSRVAWHWLWLHL